MWNGFNRPKKKAVMVKAKQSLYRKLRLPDFEIIGTGGC
jgi:hypothetical protein